MKLFIAMICSWIMIFALWLHWPDDKLHLIVCEVGQGDAILLQKGNLQVLIDTGHDETVFSCLQQHLPFWDKKIDVLILTHFDEDHIGGFATLAQAYLFDYIFLPLTDFKDSQVFLELKNEISALQSKGTQIKEPFLGQQIAFSQISPDFQAKYNSTNSQIAASSPIFLLTFLTPNHLDLEEYQALQSTSSFLWQTPENYLSAEAWQKLAYKLSDNNGSIAVFIQFGELKFLLVGDLETARELALLEEGLITRVDIQKVGHHGSKTASSMEFLEKSRPEISLISCGANNKFSHPHQEAIARLQAIGTQILRTDQLGTIEILSDGQQFWLKDKKTKLFFSFAKKSSNK